MHATKERNGALPAFVGTRSAAAAPPLTARGLPAAALAALAAAALAGCSAPIAELSADVPRAAAPAAIEATVATLEDPALRARMAHIAASPEMRALQREIVAGLLDAALTPLADDARAARVDALTTRALTRMANESPPLVTAVTRGAVDGALDAALATSRVRALERSAGAVAGAAVRGTTATLRDADLAGALEGAVVHHLGPAVETTLRDDVAPGLAAALQDPQLQRALGTTAHTLGSEMVRGAVSALGEQKPPPQDDSLLARLTGVAREGARLFGSAAWLLVAVIVLLFAWIVKLLADARRYRADASRRVAAAHLLEEAARASEGKPWAGELLGALQERARADERARAELRDVRRLRGRREAPREGLR